MAFQNNIMPMTSTMAGSISGRRLIPSSTFFKGPLALRTAITTKVPSTEQIKAEATARNRLFPMARRLLSVVKSSP